ncbi:MAG: hypothetical protein RIC89_17570 [Pseudomonadales bacterium]
MLHRQQRQYSNTEVNPGRPWYTNALIGSIPQQIPRPSGLHHATWLARQWDGQATLACRDFDGAGFSSAYIAEADGRTA